MTEILITSSVLIIVILLLRLIFAQKVRRSLIYATWILVALRLLIPVQIGRMEFSLLNSAKPVTEAIMEITDKQVAGVTDQNSYRQVLQEYIEKDPTVFMPVVRDHIQSAIEDQTPKEEIAVMIDKVYAEQEVFIPEVQPQVQEKVEATANPVTLGQVLTVIWIGGMAVMTLWFIAANLIFLRRAKKGSVEAEFEGIRVRVSPNVPTPCVVGLFRPVIYLTPVSAENEQTRAHVLAHEQAHLRHGDHIWALVRCLCLCVYWFDPLVWIAAAQSRRDCELACDETALKMLGDEERIPYGKTLLDIVSQSVSPAHLIHTATAMNESKKQLTERVNYIVKKPRNILIAAICMALITAIATGCVFSGAPLTDPNQPPTTSGRPAGTVTKPGYKLVYLMTELVNYRADGQPYNLYTNTYDKNGQLISSAYTHYFFTSANKTTTFSYNEQGLLSNISDVSDFTYVTNFSYVYNTDGTIRSYETDDGGHFNTIHHFTYDQSGRLTLHTTEYPNEGSGLPETTISGTEYNHIMYDASGRLCRIVTPHNGKVTLGDHSFVYDDQGRLIEMDGRIYGYDSNGNLILEKPKAGLGEELQYTYKNGILTGIYHTSNLTTFIPRTYTLDGNGNVIRIDWDDGRRTEYKYEAVELPDEYADRVLRYRHLTGKASTLYAYYDNIMSYFLPIAKPRMENAEDMW